MKSVFTSILFFAYAFSFAQESRVEEPPSSQEIDRLIHTYQFSKALLLLNRVEDSLSVDVHQRKGYCYFQLGNYGDAIRQFENVMKLDSINTHALFQLGQLYARNKQYGEAYACYEKLISSDTLNSFYYKQYAIVASQANAPIISLSNFFQAVKLNPRDIEAYALLGDVLLEADQYDIADSLLTQALTLNLSSQLRLLLAKAQLGEGKYEDVIRTTEQLMVKGDTLPAYARLLGISYFQLDKFDKVIPCMDFLLKNELKAEWIYYYLGVSYQRMNEQDSAIVYLNKAIEEGISENISNYYAQLATSYETIRDFKSAIKYYKAAYESSKRDILLYHLGCSYDVYYKDKAPAIAYFKRYLNSHDTIKVAREYTRHRLNELEFYR